MEVLLPAVMEFCAVVSGKNTHDRRQFGVRMAWAVGWSNRVLLSVDVPKYASTCAHLDKSRVSSVRYMNIAQCGWVGEWVAHPRELREQEDGTVHEEEGGAECEDDVDDGRVAPAASGSEVRMGEIGWKWV